MKKILPLVMLAASCLASCGENSVYGNYVFSLGKQGMNETRVTVQMDLKDENSTTMFGYKNFLANFELNGIFAATDEEMDPYVADLIEMLYEILGIDDEHKIDPSKPISVELPGLYKVSDLKDEKYGNKIKMAVDFPEINALFETIGLNPVDVISNFLVSYCNSKSFTLQVPVSLDDLQHQLAWYGTYIDYDPYLKEKTNSISDLVTWVLEGKLSLDSIKVFTLTDYIDHKLPGEQNLEARYGSHPVVVKDDNGGYSVNEVDEMNEKYQGIFSNTFVYENVGGEAGEIIGSIYKEITEEDNYYFFPHDSNFNTVNTPIDVIMKRDIGVLDYDFSEDVNVVLNVNQNKYEDGSHGFSISYKDSSEGDWDWKLFYKKPFKFRNFHDLKVELKKE